MSTRDKLLAEIARFLRRHKMGAADFGESICNDRSLVTRIRKNQSIGIDRLDQIRAFMAGYRGHRKDSPPRPRRADCRPAA